jgi:phytoene dehydrogenase-like protein
MSAFDATVVGAGPNGLAAAAHLTRHGRRVLVVEAADTIGGGARTEELTLPGFHHDVCSAIHPLGIASPFFRELGLDTRGLEWIHPEIPMSHPLDGGKALGLYRSLTETSLGLGSDGDTYRRVVGGLVDGADALIANLLGPVSLPTRQVVTTGRFGAVGALPASQLAHRFATQEAHALIAGLAAHAISPPTSAFTGAVALLFAVTAHAYGWPLAGGGSRAITDALASIVTEAGGEIETSRLVTARDQLEATDVLLLDVMPPAAAAILGPGAGSRATRRSRRWKSGPGVFKVDWALDAPIPWADDISPRAGTVHVGGTYEEIAAAEREVANGKHPDRPFVIVAQQSLFDPSRAPENRHTAWAYCHVPAGSTLDMTNTIAAQIERFAPGFGDTILAEHPMDSIAYQAHNPNYIGGDIAGGAFGIRKLLQVSNPYRLADDVFLCSSATPPGAGVHGMCGYHAAEAALR